jgi:predicted  nucleic acid-binding Zn-ribbon protein
MALPPERTQWTDPALNREFERVYKQINGTPEKMVRLEEAMKTLSHVVHEYQEEQERELAEIHKELKGSEWSRTQIIGAWATLASFVAAGAAVASVVFG